MKSPKVPFPFMSSVWPDPANYTLSQSHFHPRSTASTHSSPSQPPTVTRRPSTGPQESLLVFLPHAQFSSIGCRFVERAASEGGKKGAGREDDGCAYI